MAGLAVVVRDLVKAYPIGSGRELKVLDGVSFEARAGEMAALTGPSGSGKSTLLHILGAMDGADGGSVRVGGTEVAALPRKGLAGYRRRVGFVFQRFHLLPALTVLDNVVAPVIPYRTDFDKRERAFGLLEAVGVKEKAHALPSRLSGGQQQRVAIARALINDPGLLLADEPTGNLDSATGEGIMDLLSELNAQRGMTVLIATHDPVVARRCRTTLNLLDGRLVEGPTDLGRARGATSPRGRTQASDNHGKEVGET
jgi:putative ABC transport system ATP-binding protein